MTNPTSKTFYNHRIFVNYDADAYRQYLLDIVDTEHWPKEEEFRLKLGLMAWGTILVYQSRMVASDFQRRLKGLVNAKGEFLHQSPSLPFARPLYRQQLAMQLAIEIITRAPEVKERINEAPIVAQYIYDTLYMPSFYHERGPGEMSPEGGITEFAMTRDDLLNHLWRRSRGEPEDDQWKTFIPPATVNYLFEGVLDKYFKLLAEPKNIQSKTNQYADELPDADRRLWLELADVANRARPIATYRVNLAQHGPPAATNGETPPNG
ncbi:hypothetical protein JQ633_00080 [Bradyrhizobium tropiciagri]|uniref:hypothetical protein n=1 Tax=Bradyrhizobium tropiciagri TaxID=312253 RepID=UPI001BA8D9D8|nr:hypothetical protein [Bradyrhizobium tropiciagri]MBR0868735.1 hypothetical protein [Bradyrhizobium tropiciagri]